MGGTGEIKYPARTKTASYSVCLENERLLGGGLDSLAVAKATNLGKGTRKNQLKGNMKMAEQKTVLPQEGRTQCPESLLELSSGCPTDSGGGIEPLRAAGDCSDKIMGGGLDWSAIKDPFARRSSVGRSPPGSRRGSVSSISSRDQAAEEISDTKDQQQTVSTEKGKKNETREEEIRQPLKRPREEISPQCSKKPEDYKDPSQLAAMKAMITKLCSLSKDLTTAIKNTPNTKAEIKKGVTGICQIAEKLSKSCKEWEKSSIDKKAVAPSTSEVGVQVQIEPPESRSTKTADTQTDSFTEEMVDRIEGEEFRNQLKAIKSEREFLDFLDKPWPTEMFTNVETVVGNPLVAAIVGDLAIFTEEPEMIKGIAKQYRDRYPELACIKGVDCEQGIGYLTSTIRIPEDGGFKTSERFVFKLMPKEKLDEVNRAEELVIAVTKLKEMAEKCGRTRISLPVPENYSHEMARRVCQFAFLCSDIKIALHIPRGKKPEVQEARIVNTAQPSLESKERTKVKSRESTQKSRNTEAVVVKSDTRTFAELLRDMKQQVNLEEIGVVVKSIRKTREGEVLLTTEGGKEKIETLRTAIVEKVKDVVTRTTKKSETVLHIHDLDEITSIEEVKEAITKMTGDETDSIQVKSIRPTAAGRQIATVATTREIGERLIAAGNIRVGWSQCRVNERVNVTRCYKCLQYGHISKACTGPSKETLCFKCGEDGHKATDCTKKEKCLVCNTTEHGSSSMRCPIYRKIIRETRGKTWKNRKWRSYK